MASLRSRRSHFFFFQSLQGFPPPAFRCPLCDTQNIVRILVHTSTLDPAHKPTLLSCYPWCARLQSAPHLWFEILRFFLLLFCSQPLLLFLRIFTMYAVLVGPSFYPSHSFTDTHQTCSFSNPPPTQTLALSVFPHSFYTFHRIHCLLIFYIIVATLCVCGACVGIQKAVFSSPGVLCTLQLLFLLTSVPLVQWLQMCTTGPWWHLILNVCSLELYGRNLESGLVVRWIVT